MTSFIDFFRGEFLPLLSKDVNVAFRSDSSNSNNMGVLEGVDLDSPTFSGYIYYWSGGYLDFSLYNLKDDQEEIETTVIETKDFILQSTQIRNIVAYFKAS